MCRLEDAAVQREAITGVEVIGWGTSISANGAGSVSLRICRKLCRRLGSG